MLQKYLQISTIFAFIFIFQIILETNTMTVRVALAGFNYLVKPLITISLMIFYVYQTQLRGRFANRIFLGLFFGLIGDCLLMFVHVNDAFFTYGLIAFLIGHLCYISAFYLDYKWNPSIERKLNWYALIIFGVFCIGFYLLLRPHLGTMKIPVMVYAFVISLMGIMAVNRKGRVSTASFNLICFGAILFLISDSVLAYNKFVNSFDGAGIVIMGTYMLAQYLITIGSLERKLRKSVAIHEVKD